MPKTKLLYLLVLLAFLSCKKKNEPAIEQPVAVNPTIPASDTVINFKISLFVSSRATQPKWEKGEVKVVAPNYQQQPIALQLSNLTTTSSPSPCNDFYMNEAKIYPLQFRKGVVDTIIATNYKMGTTEVVFQGKWICDMRNPTSPIVNSLNHQAVTCSKDPSGTFRISCGTH